MAARCWGCENGVARVGVEPGPALAPLGACWECHVFGCHGHAARDAGSGKWLCYQSVADSLGGSGGIPEPVPTDTRFPDSPSFQLRFPVLAAETEDHRSYWRAGPGEGQLGSFLSRADLRDTTNWDLLSDALGVSVFLLGLPPDASPVGRLAEWEAFGRPPVLSLPLATFLTRVTEAGMAGTDA